MLIVPYITGVAGRAVSPRDLARAAGAGACLAWLNPESRGGAIYEVHLRVSASKVSSAERSVNALVTGVQIKTAALEGFADLPATLGPRPEAVTC